MPRPALEVAEIFRDYGPAWREANAAHFSLGSAYLEAGRPAPAAAGLRRAVALKPTYAEALFNLAMALDPPVPCTPNRRFL